MGRKVVMAMIGGALHIDPSDVENVDLESVKAQLKEKFHKDIPINIAPIDTWMPTSGTEALMEEAMKEMSMKNLIGCLNKSVPTLQMPSIPYKGDKRQIRRMQMREAMNKKKHRL